MRHQLLILFLCITVSVLNGQPNDPFAEFDDKVSAEKVDSLTDDAVGIPIQSGPDPLVIGMQNRLHAIESKLLEQTDRENQLLRDILKSQFEKEVEGPSEEIRTEMRTQIDVNNNLLLARIDSLERLLEKSRDQNVGFSQNMNQLLLIVAAVVIGIGFILLLVLLFMQYKLLSNIQSRNEKRVSYDDIVRDKTPKALIQTQVPEAGLLENPVVQKTNEKFVKAVNHLEERIQQMEQGLVASTAEQVEPLPKNTTVEETPPVSFDSTFTSVHGASTEFSKEVEKAVPVEPLPPKAEIAPNPTLSIDDMEVQGRSFLAGENWTAALSTYEEICKRNETRVDAWVNRGRSLEMLDREDEALASYSKAITINADLPSPFLYKAALLSRLGRFDEAQTFYNQALTRVPLQTGNKNEKKV